MGCGPSRVYLEREALLRQAAAAGDMVIVQQLLATPGLHLNATVNGGGTAVHYAAGSGHADIVVALAAAGADVNLSDRAGRTPLHWACQSGRIGAVLALLRAGANLLWGDAAGSTPLDVAVELRHWELVRTLVRAGAEVFAPNRRGLGLLSLAMLTRDAELLAAIAGLDGVAHTTPLSAVEAKLVARVAQMLKLVAGDKLNEDGPSFPFLYTATMNGYGGTVLVLLAAGADVNVEGASGETPLHAACQRHHNDIVHHLLAAGSRVGSTRRSDWATPLHVASASGNVSAVAQLLQAGARADARDRNGRGAVDVVCWDVPAAEAKAPIITLLMYAGSWSRRRAAVVMATLGVIA